MYFTLTIVAGNREQVKANFATCMGTLGELLRRGANKLSICTYEEMTINNNKKIFAHRIHPIQLNELPGFEAA